MSAPVPLCKIARENGGDVPLSCLFNCSRGCHDEVEHNPAGVTCARCGEEGLEWFDTGVRWRLVDADGKFHICKNDNAVDDFEVLE